jgi:hypothetical protein
MLFQQYGLLIALICAVLAILYGVWSIRWILAKPAGNERMQEIGAAIQEGGRADLKRQYTPIAKPIAVPQSSAKPITTSSTTPRIGLVVYWRVRYARAPSWIAAASACMRGWPGGVGRIQRIDQTP